MKISGKKLTDYLTYLAVRLVAMVVYMFPWEAVYDLAGWLGDQWYRFDQRHRNRAADHVRQSFPDWTEASVQQVVQGSFRNLVYLGIDILLTTRLITVGRWRKHIVPADIAESLRLLLERKTAQIMIAGHFSSWEVSGYAMAMLGFDGYAVARRLDNPYLDEYLMGVRERNGMRIIDKQGATEKMDEIIDLRQFVGFIADQDAGKRGVFVDFFGRAASTYKAPSLLAMQHNLPVIIGYGKRLKERFRFEIGVERIIYPSEWADRDDPLQWLTREYTLALENVVRRDPAQYLWIYRRWKTRPKDELAEAADGQAA